MDYLTLEVVLTLTATGHVDVVNVFHLPAADLAVALLTGVGNLCPMQGADLVPTTSDSPLVRYYTHEYGVTANEFLDPEELYLTVFRDNVVFLHYD